MGFTLNMKNVSKSFFVSMSILSFMLFGLGVKKSPAQIVSRLNKCEVRGKVTDRNDYVEPGAIVIFKNLRTTHQSVTDEHGDYSLDLPQDTYEIVVSRASELRYKRAKIQVSCPSDISINIYLLPECVSYGCKRAGFGFSNYSKTWIKKPGLNLLIAYNTRKTSRLRNVYDDAMLTFNNYTLSASRIVQNLKSKTILAEKGWIEDGKNRRKFDRLSMRFTKNGPIIQ